VWACFFSFRGGIRYREERHLLSEPDYCLGLLLPPITTLVLYVATRRGGTHLVSLGVLALLCELLLHIALMEVLPTGVGSGRSAHVALIAQGAQGGNVRLPQILQLHR